MRGLEVKSRWQLNIGARRDAEVADKLAALGADWGEDALEHGAARGIADPELRRHVTRKL
jgi:hypothetical protein